MDKKYYYIISAIVLLLLAIGSYIAFGLSSGDFTNTGLANGSANSSTNSTQPFRFKFVNASQLTASCNLYVGGVDVAQNTSVRNSTNTTLYSNTSFGSDGLKSWYVNCTNTTTVKFATQEFILDTTSPTYIYADLPTDSYNTSNSTMLFRVSGIDAIGDYYQSGMVNFTLWVNGQNKSVFTYGNNTQISFTEVFPDGNYNWNITIRDNASNSLRSSTNSFIVDTTGPTIGSYTTVNVSGTASTSGNMVARYNFTTTDAYMVTPTAYITIVSNGTSVNRTGTHTTNDTGLSIMHQIDLAPSDIPYDGYFVATPHGRDSLGNDVTGTNQTNFTKVSLYTGWNLIQVQQNYTLYNVSELSNEITKVSVWNTSSQGYDTFTVGSTTNMAQAVKDGDAVYVYTKANVGLLRKWSFDMGNARNLSLSTGWNTLTAFNTSIQLYNLCRQTIDNASATIKAVSFYDASRPIYYSQVCSIATGFNNNVTVPRGKGYWFNVNTTTTFMNRR